MSAGYRHYPITYNVNLDPIRLSSILSIFVFAGHLSYLKLGNVTQTEFDVRLATIVMEVILFFCSLQFYFYLANFSEDCETMPSDNIIASLKSRPEVVYHLIQTTFFAVMAVTTLRFKFLWMPHICIVGAGLFCNQSCWRFLFIKLRLPGIVVRHLITHFPRRLCSIEYKLAFRL